MTFYEIRDKFAHNLCGYLRNKEQGFLQELLKLCSELKRESDPYILEYVEKKCLRYSKFLKELPQDFQPAEEDLERTVKLARLLFKNELYFEVHELLEEVWMGEFGENRDFLQALIQIGAAYYHLENFNSTGFKLLLDNALELLNGYEGVIFGIDVNELKEKIKAAKREFVKIEI